MDTPSYEPHECPGCGTPGVRWDMFGCRACWLMLPWDIRDRIMQGWHARLAGKGFLAHVQAKSDAMHWYAVNHPAHRKVSK